MNCEPELLVTICNSCDSDVMGCTVVVLVSGSFLPEQTGIALNLCARHAHIVKGQIQKHCCLKYQRL